MNSILSSGSIDETLLMNGNSYNHYFMRLKMLCTVMYSWEGLPVSMSKRFIENNLFKHGQLAFFYDDELGYIVTKCTQSGELNIYDEPLSYNCYGNNGYQKTVAAADCVIIRNNMDCIPTTNLIELFCSRLYTLERTMDINIAQMKTPVIIQCEESQRLTLKNLMMKYQGNEPFIYGNKQLDLDGIKVFKTDAPYIADKLFQLKNEKWIECLSMLGINNANTQKKERLNVDEVNSNNQLLTLESDVMLMCREYACQEIKEKFGLDITVELRRESEEPDQDQEVEVDE